MSYFQHVARDLRRGDVIEVFPKDGTWYAELLVRSVGKVEALTAAITVLEFSSADVSSGLEDFKVTHRGRAKWSVLQGSTVMVQGLETREAAEAWVRDYTPEIAA